MIHVCGGERASSSEKLLGFFGARSDRIETTKKERKRERKNLREREREGGRERFVRRRKIEM